MNIVVSDEQDDPLPAVDLLALAEVVLRGERFPATTEVAITLVDEAHIASLNARHLGNEGSTDVLSFPLEDLRPGVPPEPLRPGGPPLAIGDVVISPPVVRGRAQASRVAFEDEMALMVVHGLLHLMGYDHVADADAEVMEARERHYLALVGRIRR